MHKTFLGKRSLRDLRQAAGLSVDEVANLTGVSAVRYRQWENGHRSPHLPELRKLAEALKVSADAVLAALEVSAEELEARRAGKISAEVLIDILNQEDVWVSGSKAERIIAAIAKAEGRTHA